MKALAFDFLILCGGRATRMQGRDKPLLPYQGRPMVASIAATAPDATQIWISANRNQAQYAQWGQVFSDEEVMTRAKDEPAGPLVGILGGLERCQQDWLLVSPGDTPNLPEGWYSALLEQTKPDGAVVFDGGRQQHLHLLLARELHTDLRAQLQAGEHRVWHWLSTLKIATVEINHPEWFSNINTPDDLQS
ncbi:MAG: molybdenum cofactor guanylyltransferase [Pseudomonadales bacterium]